MALKFKTIIVYLCIGVLASGCSQKNTNLFKKKDSALYLDRRAPEDQSINDDAIESIPTSIQESTDNPESYGNYYAFNKYNEDIKYYKPKEVFVEKKVRKKVKKKTKLKKAEKADSMPAEAKKNNTDDKSGSIVKVIPNINTSDSLNTDKKPAEMMDKVQIPAASNVIPNIDIEKEAAFLKQDPIKSFGSENKNTEPERKTFAPILSTKKKNGSQNIQQNAAAANGNVHAKALKPSSEPTKKQVPKPPMPGYRPSKTQDSADEYVKNIDKNAVFETYHPEHRPMPLPFDGK